MSDMKVSNEETEEACRTGVSLCVKKKEGEDYWRGRTKYAA